MLQFVTYRSPRQAISDKVKSFFEKSTLFTINHLQNPIFFVIIIVSECFAKNAKQNKTIKCK